MIILVHNRSNSYFEPPGLKFMDCLTSTSFEPLLGLS
jgi:hypothetical protein